MKNGQALAVVVVIIGVVLTIGLSIATRSVTEVNISTGQKESASALEAAEAGVEQALGGQIGTGNASGTTQNASFDVQNSVVSGSAYTVPYKMDRGDVATVNLNGFSGTGICIYFGETTTTEVALELILYSRNGSTYSVGRQGIDPDSHGNGFSGLTASANCSLSWSGHETWTNLVNMGMPSGHQPVQLRIRMLYNSTAQPLVIAPAVAGINLPAQGNEIISTGRSGESVQKVRVVSLNPDLPLVFDSAIFSGGDISQ